tara:strand:- start:59246 stop:59410 length:165 start_codon:yes stop_codon:yes gene_type:complete
MNIESVFKLFRTILLRQFIDYLPVLIPKKNRTIGISINTVLKLSIFKDDKHDEQ